MCGIAGIIKLDGNAELLSQAIQKMGQRMDRRGPDDEGYILEEGKRVGIYKGDKSVFNNRSQPLYLSTREHIQKSFMRKSLLAFGHRRLRIVDLSPLGHQPMCDSTGNYWIIFNGEIYNFQEIKNKLEKLGHRFISTSDTEMIVVAYKQWGEQMLQQFNGMFALVIYDRRRKEVFIARDRVGIKPLYYTINKKSFVFASDIKTIIASKLYKPTVNMEGLWHNCSFAVAPRPSTCFENVFSLEQAHWMKIDLSSGKMYKQRYWQIPIATQDLSMTETQAITLIGSELNKAIERRLFADVEVATFMSGGLDSSTISALASIKHPGITAFTLDFTSDLPEYNETQQATDTANMYDMNHVVTTIGSDKIIPYIDEMVACYEEPTMTLSPNYVISKIVAKNNLKVVLIGLGSDELLAGYDFFTKTNQWRRLQKFSFFSNLIPRGINRKLTLGADLSSLKTIGQYYAYRYSTFHDNEKRRLFSDNVYYDSLNIFDKMYNHNNLPFTDDLEALSYFDMMHFIGNHHVYRVDQFTMFSSIEGRLPFLDHELVEAAYRIPSKYKYKNGITKYVLREMAKKYIAPSCIDAPKKGFRLPVGYWIKDSLEDVVKDHLYALKQRKVFNNNEIDKISKSFSPNNYKKMWYLVMVEKWFQQMIDG